jgi:hypothetical protein
MRRIKRNLSRILINGEKSRHSGFTPDQDGWNLKNDKQFERVREIDNSECKQQKARNKNNRAKYQRPASPAKRLKPSPCAENPQDAKQSRAGIQSQFQSSRVGHSADIDSQQM